MTTDPKDRTPGSPSLWQPDAEWRIVPAVAIAPMMGVPKEETCEFRAIVNAKIGPS
jgi:hypothetical protein